MEFTPIDNTNIAELITKEVVVKTVQDGTDLIGNAYYQGFEKIIVRKEQITDEFFDLKTKLAGEILQKFSNYRVRLAIVGDFSGIESKSLRDFIRESNKGKLVNFLETREEAVLRLSI